MSGFPEIEEGLEQNDFFQSLSELTDIYDFGTIVNGPLKNREDPSPLGLFTIQVEKNVAYPHARWFPWATARNKIEAWIPFLQTLHEDYTTIIYCEEENIPFFVHLCKYGILIRRGTILEYFEDGGKAAFFQTRKI